MVYTDYPICFGAPRDSLLAGPIPSWYPPATPCPAFAGARPFEER